MTPRQIFDELLAMQTVPGVVTCMGALAYVGSPNPAFISIDVVSWRGGTYTKVDLTGIVGGDDFAELLSAGWRAIATLESRRIAGDANPGEGDFIKHLGRA